MHCEFWCARHTQRAAGTRLDPLPTHGSDLRTQYPNRLLYISRFRDRTYSIILAIQSSQASEGESAKMFRATATILLLAAVAGLAAANTNGTRFEGYTFVSDKTGKLRDCTDLRNSSGACSKAHVGPTLAWM